MKPISVTRVVSSSVLAEAEPVSVGLAKVYRGMDLGRPLDEIAGKSRRDGPLGSPFRDPPAVAPALVPVIVREVSETSSESLLAFERATIARRAMTGTPAPRLLHVLGEGKDRVLASVEEIVGGTSLREVLDAARARGEEVPVGIALAIASGLLPMWFASSSAPDPIHLLVDPGAVIIDVAGRIRATPMYGVERARQVVGAAILILGAEVSYAPPEEVRGSPPDARSAMFTLGLLLYEMIGGAHPHARSDTTMWEVLSRTVNGDAAPIRDRRPGVHPSVAELVHRCLARDPDMRFPSWRELSRVFAAVLALFPPTGPDEISRYVRGLVPAHPTQPIPPVADPEIGRLGDPPRYHAVSLRWTQGGGAWKTEDRSWGPTVIDPSTVYPTADARPMVAVSPALLVDARPVTRAELERFFLATRSPRPSSLGEPGAVTDDDPCTLVPIDVAEAYARWAGKRLPTEAEWDEAVGALGAARLGTGEVWEWTSTPHENRGYVVRGGRWRDQASMPPRPENRSFATSPAADIGFRCVLDPYE